MNSICPELPKRTRRIRSQLALAAAMVIGASVPATAADHYCTTSAQVTTALTNASLTTNDTITLDAAATFAAPAGGWVLPNKTGTGWITIRTSAHASLPAVGRRVNLTHANVMPLLRPGDTTSPTFKTNPGAHHYKFIGLEITGPTADTQPDGITDISHAPITLGDIGTNQDTLAEVPNNIVIDRCIVRANSNTQRIRRGIQVNSASTDITNCYIAGFKDVDGNDTQAISGYNGPGPFNIINNYLEAAGENILFGGGLPSIANLVPSDIVVKKNHFSRPLHWNQNHSSWGNLNWVIKNIFELKNGRNVLVEGNILEHNWVDGQPGWAIVLTPANDGGAPWTVVENVTFKDNIIRGIAGGPNIIAYDASGDPSLRSNRLYFRNNLWYDFGGTLWGNGKFMQTGGPLDTLVVDHNTAFSTDNILSPSGGQSINCQFTNNMLSHGQYGFKGPSSGNTCFNDFFSGPSGVVFLKNVMRDNSTYSLATLLNFYSQYTGGWSPTSLAFPQNDWTGVLVNQAAPGSNFAGYKVVGWDQPTNASLYPYNNTATDGADIGCNIDVINTATAGCISGVWAAPPTTITLKNGVNGYTGATSFHVRGQSATTNHPANAYFHETNNLVGTNGFVLRPFYKFNVTQAASGIPAGATIVSATFRVKVEMRSVNDDNGIAIYRVAPTTGFTVNYATATRNTYNGTNSWTGGANAGDQDHVTTPVDSNSTIPAVNQWIDFDVTSAVQTWVNGTANNGLIIKPNPTVSTATLRLSTTADLHGSAEYPTLEVTYQ